MPRIPRRTWSTPEKAVARKRMITYLEDEKLPPVNICESIVKAETVLQRRTALQLRLWVHNEIRKQSSKGNN